MTAISKIKVSLIACIACTVSMVQATGYKTITNKEIKNFYKNLPFEMPVLKTPKFKKHSVNIVDFGAVSDGITLNTEAFDKAIKAVAAKGGGTVVIPEGIWLTGPITLVSNINLL